MNWTATAAFALALAVVFGAFGAHGLRDRLDEYSLGVYEKAVFYHFIHALGMLAAPLLARAGLVTGRMGAWAGWSMLVGVVFFSGSLYALAITRVTVLGAITPIGGVAFILGWMALAWGAISARRPDGS